MSFHSFSVHYLKGNDMILSDFLSRIQGDKECLHEATAISFYSHSILANYYTFFNLPSETYRVVTRHQTKAVRTQMPKVNGTDNVVDPILKPEIQSKKEGILKSIPVGPQSVSHPQRIILSVLPRKGREERGLEERLLDLYHKYSLIYTHSVHYTRTSNYTTTYTHTNLGS